MIDHCIEKLLCYGQTHLMMDDLDVIYARNLIMDELKLDNYTAYEVDIDEIDALENPYELVQPIGAYALNAKIVEQKNLDAFYAKILGFISLLPSQITDTFNGVYSKNPQKAFSWFNDYCVKNGSVLPATVSKNLHWEAKNTQGRIEVTVGKTQEKTKAAYPKCGLCQENEGFRQNRNMRILPMPAESDDWFYTAEKNPYLFEQGCFVKTEHVAGEFNNDFLLQMTQLLDIAPNYYLAAGSKADEHTHVYSAGKSTPFFKAAVSKKFKNPECPYIEAYFSDWYNANLTLAYSNAKILCENVYSIISEFKKLNKTNEVVVFLKKAEQKYYFTLHFISDKKLSAEIADILGKEVSVLDFSGHIMLGSQLKDAFVRAEQYLSGQKAYDAKDEQKQYVSMIEALLKDGSANSVLEAQLNIRDYISGICEKALTQSCGFKSEKEFLEFVASLGFAVV